MPISILKEGIYMQRYFVNDSIEHDCFLLKNEDRHHIEKVMRMKIDDRIICVDPSGNSAICSIAEITDESIVAKIVQLIEETSELPIMVTIASGLPKGDKLELIIQKGTELGAIEFVPFAAARSIVKWDEKKSSKKVDRWQKISKEAAEQAHRNYVPEVKEPISFKALLEKSSNYQYKIVAFEDESRMGEISVFSSVLTQIKKGETLLFVFGPEGGLTETEIEQLKENGFKSCGLGPRILRTETAPLYALSAVSYHFELMR